MERMKLQKTLDIVAGTVLASEILFFLNSSGFQEMINVNPVLALPAVLSLGYLFGRILGNMPVEGHGMPYPTSQKKRSRSQKPKK